MLKRKGSKLGSALLLASTISMASPQLAIAKDSEATQELKEQSVELQRDIVKVADGVYTAVGISPANISMIVGETGLIIVDTGMSRSHAEEALAEFRKISSLPIVGVIFTHGHGDHTGGAAAFTADGSPQVWARANFGSEGEAFTSAGLTIQNARGAKQGGFRLPPEQRINNGVALPFYPAKEDGAFTENQSVAPTDTFSEPRKAINIAGVNIELVVAPGETDDGLYVWLPEQKVVFTGDNFYASWPNLYAIRGTPYRDIQAWAATTDLMLQEGPDHVVPGHTRPIIGKEAATGALTDYRDAIDFVFDKTVEGINKGLTPDELVAYVKLPDQLASRPYLREYYGNVEWAVRAIFSGYLGWFDGNPTNLFSLPPMAEAERMATLAGGKEALLANARDALVSGDAQWAAQLSDFLIALDPQAAEPKIIKADALTNIAENLLTATGRNYLLTSAAELRNSASTGEQ